MAFMGTKSASSSSSSTTSGFKYDVFLSFRGSDTRKNFTDHLYAALKQKGIFTFRDDEKLERGTFIAPELLRAIEESRFAVVIISQDYASSSWCLVELAKIVECMEKERLIVLPVFHYIDPSDVGNLKNTFGEAFAKHEERFEDSLKEVYEWKNALTQVAKIAGWDLRDKHEANVVEEIVRKISNKLNSTYSIVHKDFVGINSRMEELVNLLGMGLNDVRFIGICGMGGLGKTTLARVVYDRFRYYFEGSSFLANVREECEKHGLVHLQKQLLSDILIERNIDFSDVQWGSNVIERRLCYKSVLIVLDDVDQLDQLEALAGKRVWFGRGSRVIITTRDQHLLIKHDVAEAEIYKPKELNSDEALQLFSRKAFKKDHPSEGYVELSKKAICYAQGLPLALSVLVTFLEHRSPDVWESVVDRLKETPPKKILDTHRISFDGLEETQKELFLDIACFFKGEDKDRVTNILETPHYKPSIDIDVLVEKSLITISGRNLWMHDLLQIFGQQIVRCESPEQPGNRSRLWLKKDVLHVLKYGMGSKKIRGIMLHSPQSIKVELHTEAFRMMENLKFLIVENVHVCKPLEFLPKSLILLKWPHYPFHWPSEYFLEQLVAIEMPHSRIRLPKLNKQQCRLENLIDVNLSSCELIEKLPKLSAPNLENLDLAYCKNLVKLSQLWAPNLKFLKLRHCESLVEIDECFGYLEKLEEWDLTNCKKLQFLPSQLRLKSLYIFDLSGCSRLEKLPDFHPKMECLKTLSLSGIGIGEMPSSIEHLTKLENVIELDLLMKPDYFPALESINLSGSNIVTIPDSISRFPSLKSLFITNCKLLREIQGLPQSIRLVRAENCMLLDSQSLSGLLNQVIEIIGILPSRVCGRARSHKLMDPQLTNYFSSETEGAESEDFPSETEGIEREDRDDYCTILVWGTEMPKWFNHQSVENSIIFGVGRKFPKLAICVVLGQEGCYGFVDISINGREKREYGYFDPSERDYSYNLLFLHSPSQWRLQQQLNESNPTDQNHVEVTYRAYEFDDDDVEPNSYIEPLNPTLIKRWGIHVECTCPPQEFDDDDVVDYWRKLPFFDFFPSQEYDLKRLLLYCSLFPLGYEFGKEEMVQLWIAEEFIKERQRMEVAGCEYFDYLVEVEFIQDSRYDYSVDFYSFLSDEFDSNGGKKLYKVNEAQASLLKMAISEGSYQSELGDKLDVASEFDSNGGKKLFKVNEAQASLLKMAISEGGYQSEFGDKLDVASELTRHLSLPCESINDQMAIETLKRCTNLHTLLLLSGCGYNVKQVPRDLFLSLKLLRTLNLSRTLISELPSSIGNVKSLRYLDVSNTHIRRLPESIDCLSNLQTLKLKGCLDFVALPKNMKKLTNLRHLELDIVRQLISMPKRIGNLTNLQTLSAFLVGRDDECGIEELKNMNDLCGTFCISRLERVSSLDKAKEAALIDKMYLDKLELRWSDIRVVNPEEEEEILESLQPHSGLREIQILFYGGIKIPSWICNPSFADLVSITLYKCRNCEFLPSLGDLPSLKFLFIREMNEVKKIDHQFCRNGSDKGFAKLEKLEINVMLNLEEWMGVENGDLPVLRKLTVEYFPKLIALPSLSCLNSLEHLEIKHCSRLQCLPNEGLPTSLEFLLIKGCPELKERCCKEEGLDWGKIEHVPNIWIDHQEISSS